MPKKAPSNRNDPETTWREEAGSLNYEEALQALDLLLARLQDESLPLSDLQGCYQRAEIYLGRCEHLLGEIEQRVLRLNPDTLDTEPLEQQNDA